MVCCSGWIGLLMRISSLIDSSDRGRLGRGILSLILSQALSSVFRHLVILSQFFPTLFGKELQDLTPENDKAFPAGWQFFPLFPTPHTNGTVTSVLGEEMERIIYIYNIYSKNKDLHPLILSQTDRERIRERIEVTL